MKTSEFIRYAVDKYLSERYLNLNEIPLRHSKTSYLCLAFDKAGIDLGEKLDKQLYKARVLVEIILKDSNGILDSSFYVVGSKAGYWKSREECSEELQQIRFMLAEFMALYFEDQGD